MKKLSHPWNLSDAKKVLNGGQRFFNFLKCTTNKYFLNERFFAESKMASLFWNPCFFKSEDCLKYIFLTLDCKMNFNFFPSIIWVDQSHIVDHAVVHSHIFDC